MTPSDAVRFPVTSWCTWKSVGSDGCVGLPQKFIHADLRLRQRCVGHRRGRERCIANHPSLPTTRRNPIRRMALRAPPRRRVRRVGIVNLPNDINNTIAATGNFLGPHEFVYTDTWLCLARILQPTCKDGNRIMIADWRVSHICLSIS